MNAQGGTNAASADAAEDGHHDPRDAQCHHGRCRSDDQLSAVVGESVHAESDTDQDDRGVERDTEGEECGAAVGRREGDCSHGKIRLSRAPELAGARLLGVRSEDLAHRVGQERVDGRLRLDKVPNCLFKHGVTSNSDVWAILLTQ